MSAAEYGPIRLESAPELPESSDVTIDLPVRQPDRAQELAAICRSHHSALLRLLAVRTGSAEDAKEILQEAYAKVLSIDRPGTISLMAGYLWRTAVNLAMDRKRKDALHKRFFRSTLALSETRDLSAEATVESRERLAIVQRAIGELPPRCLEAFVLHVLKSRTFIEVGRAMGISEQMSRKHVARALEYLQSCLDAADNARRVR